MIKIVRSNDDLNTQLSEQLEILSNLCNDYDNGSFVMAKSMAASIRNLLYDGGNSKSILNQLSIKDNIKFFDSSIYIDDGLNNTANNGRFALIQLDTFTDGSKYSPVLDGDLQDVKMTNFDEYWNKIIIIDNKNNYFSRQKLIKEVADTDGGAHVDPGLKTEYYDLSRNNSIGWLSSTNDGSIFDVRGAELASVRQIAHEILKTFIPEYKPIITSAQEPYISMRDCILDIIPDEELVIRRQGPCPCGSGKKYKRCCGARTA